MTTTLVIGASGTLGTVLVPCLINGGHDVRPASRHAREGWATADLRTGEGLADAVRDADAIVHLASSPKRPKGTDISGTRRLVAAVREAARRGRRDGAVAEGSAEEAGRRGAGNVHRRLDGAQPGGLNGGEPGDRGALGRGDDDQAAAGGVRHLLYVSIIGVERVPLAYYRAKLAAEEIVRGSGIPYTILRVSQFHPFAVGLLEKSARLGPLIIDPGFLAQPVDVADVADRIVALLDRGPVGGTVEFAGPRVITLEEAATTWLAARDDRRRVVRFRVPGRGARAMRDGALTTTATPTGVRTWEDYLAARY